MANRTYLNDEGDHACATCGEDYDNVYSAMACYDSHLRERHDTRRTPAPTPAKDEASDERDATGS